MGYTKGPWRVVEANTPGVLYIDGPAQKLTIITTAIDIEFADYVKRTADAHLIAAAPDLLEALEGMLQIYGVTELNLTGGSIVSAVEVECCNIARAAIKRAKGELA